jgi:hypothetical protein
MGIKVKNLIVNGGFMTTNLVSNDEEFFTWIEFKTILSLV